MANITTLSGVVLEITGLDADWWWKIDLPAFIRNPSGIWIHSIQFNPGAADDRMIIRIGTLAAPPIFDMTCASSSDSKIKHLTSKALQRPVIDISECVFTNPANAKVFIEVR